jgi:signal peptidase II
MRNLQTARGAALTGPVAGEPVTGASGAREGLPPDVVGLPDEAEKAPRRRAPRRLLVLFALVAAVVLAVDITSKVLVVAMLADRPPVKLLGGLVYLVHARNTGAAFSLASGFTVVLTVIAVGVVVAVLKVASRLASPAWAVALGLILGGATGNLVDRLFRDPGPFRGGVVDFLALLDPVQPPWPIFNLADSALVTGVLLALLLELMGRRWDGRRVRDSRGE